MGCGKSIALSPEQKEALKQEKDRNKKMDFLLAASQEQDVQVSKLLLLGAGGAGKSTLFKQMIHIYGKGYPEEERKSFNSVICSNIIASMKVLISQCPNFGKCEAVESQRIIEEEIKGDEVIDEALGQHLMALWQDSGIRTTYENRSKYQITDSTAYYFGRLPDIIKEDYIPTQQDILRSRIKTTGIVENSFVIDGNHFKMFDVGGQRSERKKWIHCFENVTSVLFVAAISAYDQVLYEDENTNRMVEALNLFGDICNSRWFRETSMILFLNKIDLFREKIKRVPLSVCFQEYEGKNEEAPAKAYIESQFHLQNRGDKHVYSHVTNATDTDHIAFVFNAVKDIIIRKSLNEAGLV